MFATSSWHWDGTTLRAETSRRGLIALYYAALPNRFIVGTDIREVIHAVGQVTIDRPAMLIFHLLYQYVGGTTPYREIKVLPLDGKLTWNAATGLRVTRRRPLEPRRFEGSIETARRRCAEIVRSVVQAHRGSGDHVIALSGGRDSRHILLALRASGLAVQRIVTAHHYLDFTYAEVAVARQLAERIGMKAEVKLPYPDRVAAEVVKNWLTGLQTMSHSWGLALADAAAGSRTVYDGMNGSSLLGGARLASLERTLFPGALEPPPWPLRRDRVVAAIMNQNAIQVLPDYLTRPKIVDAARALLSDALDYYGGFPNPAQAFRFYETGPREFPLLTLGMLRNEEVLCPLDADAFAEFALGLPWGISNDEKFHEEVLKVAYPDFADIPFEKNAIFTPGRPLTDPIAERRSFDRALSAIGPNRTSALIPQLDNMLRQPALTYRQIQRSIYALQSEAIRLNRDVLLGFQREELPSPGRGHAPFP